MVAETMITLLTPDYGIQQLRHLSPEQLWTKLDEAREALLAGRVACFWVKTETMEPEHTVEDLQGEEAVVEGVVPT